MTDIREQIGIEENRERGETAIQLVLDKQKNETMAMYRKGIGWIAFLWGSSGSNSDFSDGMGVARIIALNDAKKKNDPSLPSGRELLRSAPEIIAKGRIKRKYGPPGDRRVDIIYNQNLVTLAWDRARRTFYLYDIVAKAESWIMESSGSNWKDKIKAATSLQELVVGLKNLLLPKMDTFPFDEVKAAYGTTSNNVTNAAKVEQSWFENSVNSLRNTLEQEASEDEKSLIPGIIEKFKSDYLTKRRGVWAVRKNTLSWHVAGRSKFDSNGAGEKNNSLDKAEEDFGRWLEAEKAMILDETGITAKIMEAERLKAVKKAKVKQWEDNLKKALKKDQNKLPIINQDGEGYKQMTSAEWSKTSNDYKGIAVSQDGTHRYRHYMWTPVFIADKPIKTISESASDEAIMESAKFKKKGKYELHDSYEFMGLPIAIENKAGSYREGVDPDGHKWKQKMFLDYGYIKKTEGEDGEGIDVYVGEKPSDKVYIVKQHKIEEVKKWDSEYCPGCGEHVHDCGCPEYYDEDKVFLGFDSKQAVKEAYLKQYDSPLFLGPIFVMNISDFHDLLEDTNSPDLPWQLVAEASTDWRDSIQSAQGIGDLETAFRNALYIPVKIYTPTDEEATKNPEKESLRTLESLEKVGGSVIANGLAKAWRGDKPGSLVGQKAKTVKDFAILSQIYRNPSFETFRIFFLNNENEIVHQTGVSSRLPGRSGVFPSDQDPNVFLKSLFESSRRAGGKKIALLHNHPSGNIEPSEADIAITKEISRVFSSVGIGFFGHIIVNHGEYSIILASGKVAGGVIPNKIADESYDTEEPTIDSPLLWKKVSNAEDVVKIGLAVRKANFFTVIGRRPNGVVSGIGDMPIEALKDSKTFGEALRNFALATGSAGLFAANMPKIDAHYIGGLNRRYNYFMDIITDEGESLLSERGDYFEAPGNVFSGKNDVSELVTESALDWKDQIRNAHSIDEIVQIMKDALAVEQEAGSRSWREYVDTGEKLGGAKKDMWAAILAGQKALETIDLEGMDSGTASKLVNKKNVTRDTLQSCIDKGAEPGAVFLMNKILGSYDAKPGDTDLARESYVKGHALVQEYLQTATSIKDIEDIIYQIEKELTGYILTPEEWQKKDAFDAKEKNWHKLRDEKWTEFLAQFQKGPFASKNAIDKAFKASTEWQYQNKGKYLPQDEIAAYNRLVKSWHEREDKNPESRRNLYKALGEKFVKIIKGQSQSFIDNVVRAKDINDFSFLDTIKEVSLRKKTNKPQWVRNVPENVELTRNDAIIFKPEDLTSKFGIRGVEYGNWVDEESAKHHTQMLGLSLLDLSDILGISPEKTSYGGRLGIRFGSNGTGKFAAHYEPSHKAINLTKLKGGGSFAHEWAHFLDNVVHMVSHDGDVKHSYGSDSVSGANKVQGNKTQPFGDKLPKDVENAFTEIHKLMTEGNEGRNESKPDDPGFTSYNANMISAQISKLGPQGAMDYFANSTRGSWSKAKRETVRTPIYNTEMLQKIADFIHFKTGEKVLFGEGKSKFMYTSSSWGGEYWTRPHELFARAFEAIVNKKMKDRGARNTYLVYGVDPVDGAPYPDNDELERLEPAFDKLIALLKENKILERAIEIEGSECVFEAAQDWQEEILTAKTIDDIKKVFSLMLNTKNQPFVNYLASMDDDDLEGLINSQETGNLSTFTKIDWGNTKDRGQGERVGYMVAGAMSDAPRGVKSITRIAGKLKLTNEQRQEIDYSELYGQLLYAKARKAGFNHDQAMVYSYIPDIGETRIQNLKKYISNT